MVEMGYYEMHKIKVGDFVKFATDVYDPAEKRLYPAGHVFMVKDIYQLNSGTPSLEVIKYTQVGAYWVSHWAPGTELSRLIYG